MYTSPISDTIFACQRYLFMSLQLNLYVSRLTYICVTHVFESHQYEISQRQNIFLEEFLILDVRISFHTRKLGYK